MSKKEGETNNIHTRKGSGGTSKGILRGFLVGGAIIVIGLILHLSVGPVAWNTLRWPINGMVLGVGCLTIVVMSLLRKRVFAFRFIGTYHAAIPALAYAVMMTIVMGLTTQTASGKWFNNMLSFWPFVLIYVYLAVILGMVIVKRCVLLCRHRDGQGMIPTIPFILNHLGLFIVMVTATLGNADMQRMKVITTIGEQERRAIDEQGRVREAPFAIELKKFIMETYDDGSPRRFASELQILTKSGENIHATVDVNKPIKVEGWKIYQYGYDTLMGDKSSISILEMVSDPWLPAVYTGICMMLLGAVCMFFLGGKRKTPKR